ncbi:MAG: hypothetical protein NVS1B11_15120 [Terriglobales bacterium]
MIEGHIMQVIRFRAIVSAPDLPDIVAALVASRILKVIENQITERVVMTFFRKRSDIVGRVRDLKNCAMCENRDAWMITFRT